MTHTHRKLHWRVALAAGACALTLGVTVPGNAVETFDHDYRDYAAVLRDHVVGARVDYAKLSRNRAALDAVVDRFGRVTRADEERWARDERLAFWINAYNAFTLQVIIDHYPIEGRFFSLYPRNSIRQISGVWDRLTWPAAGRTVTLDQIEHEIIRPTFDEARIHFAVNCASISCPPLRTDPYRAGVLDAQLANASRTFLASDQGLQVSGSALRVTSLFRWYGEDFVKVYAPIGPASVSSATDRAILGTIIRYGPPAAVELARSGRARISYLSYDWGLNDTSAE